MPERVVNIRLSYMLTFESAFHCGTGLPRLLVDRAISRDADGALFIPGSTLKGVLRDRCDQIASLFGLSTRFPHDEVAALQEYATRDLSSRLFGSRLYPGALYFDNLVMSPDDYDILRETPALQSQNRTQVSLSRRTGTARPRFLFSSEFGLTGLRFEGEVYGYVPDIAIDRDQPTGPTYALTLLLAGLMALDRIGGNRSSGMGRCGVSISSLQVDGEPSNPVTWLGRLADLEYAELATQEEHQ
jgi:CRISPR/Cas system CSM-associated protein Csm3 (group 7 of RAMP superfamily)